ncbi:unnamed protein product [Camellia sinensis]
MDGFDKFKIVERWVRERMSSFVAKVAIFESHGNNGCDGFSSELLHFFFSLLKLLLVPMHLVPLPGMGILLNEWSKVNISYSVKSPSSAPLSLVIAQGRESLVEWIEDPLYPNTTLSWNIIHGNRIIQREVLWSTLYYIAVGNLNSEEVEVQLNFTIKGFLYNTT